MEGLRAGGECRVHRVGSGPRHDIGLPAAVWWPEVGSRLRRDRARRSLALPGVHRAANALGQHAVLP